MAVRVTLTLLCVIVRLDPIAIQRDTDVASLFRAVLLIIEFCGMRMCENYVVADTESVSSFPGLYMFRLTSKAR